MARNRVADQGSSIYLNWHLSRSKPDHGVRFTGNNRFRGGQLSAVVDLWTRLLEQLQPGSEQAKAIEVGIAELVNVQPKKRQKSWRLVVLKLNYLFR